MPNYSFEWCSHTVDLLESKSFQYADAIEEFVCLGRLIEWRKSPADVPFGQLAKAVAALFAEAGVFVKPQELRREMVRAANSSGEELLQILAVIDWLLLVVNDGIWELSEGDEGGSTDGKKDQPA